MNFKDKNIFFRLLLIFVGGFFFLQPATVSAAEVVQVRYLRNTASDISPCGNGNKELSETDGSGLTEVVGREGS